MSDCIFLSGLPVLLCNILFMQGFKSRVLRHEWDDYPEKQGPLPFPAALRDLRLAFLLAGRILS